MKQTAQMIVQFVFYVSLGSFSEISSADGCCFKRRYASILPVFKNKFQKKSLSNISSDSFLFFVFSVIIVAAPTVFYNTKYALAYIVNERGESDERRFFFIIFYLDFLIIVLLIKHKKQDRGIELSVETAVCHGPEDKKGEGIVAELSELFRGYDEKRLEAAIKRAKLLSENPQVQEAFSRVDREEIVRMLRDFNDMDKNKLMKTFLKSNHQELIRIISNLK